LQLQQITATGTEKALLADMTEKQPDASYVDLLRLFMVRRSVADGHSQHAGLHLCLLRVMPASIFSQMPHATRTFGRAHLHRD
jgi:hypothetical protein